jgi:predicted AAA+ superfamily ATPase
VREVGHPKFYFFDPGVARVAAQIDVNDFGSTEMGSALETLLFNEIRIYQEISHKPKNISYYATPGSGEIDFIIELRPKTIDRPAEFLSIEIKASTKWKSDFERPSRALKQFAQEKHKRMIGVYLGSERLTQNGFEIFPVMNFIDHLFTGKIF